MKRREKFLKGDVITSVDELARQKFVFRASEVADAAWFLSLQLRYAVEFVNTGNLRYAIPKVLKKGSSDGGAGADSEADSEAQNETA